MHATGAEVSMPGNPVPFHLSIPCHSLAEARRFYGEILGCEERRANATSAHFDWFGSQLTIHEVDGYTASNLHREVAGEDVPVPHFGAALEHDVFQNVAANLERTGAAFVLPPHKRFIDTEWEQWVLFVLDPSGNAIEIKSFTKIAAFKWR
jgi:extradiol dioxygenase family protein